MNNCKKCGSLMHGDFLFCGICGEPVNNTQKPDIVIEVKKSRKIKFLREKNKNSVPLNLTFAGIWLVLTGSAVILLINTAAFLKSSSESIRDTLRQISLKYAYVNESFFSVSYIASECREAAEYFLKWIYAAALIIFLAAGIFFIYSHLSRAVRLMKKKRVPVSLDKIQAAVITAIKIIFFIFALIILAAYIFIIVI